MSLSGEKLLITATLDSVEPGQVFDELPPHMSVNRWFTMPEDRRHYVTDAMDALFNNKPAFDNAAVGAVRVYLKNRRPTLVHQIHGLETISNDNQQNPQWFALNALIRSLGHFDEDDKYNQKFSPHISHVSGLKLRRNEPVSFASAVLFATEGIQEQNHVIASFHLGHNNG